MLEKPLERLLFACRWLLAPIYLGLSLTLLAMIHLLRTFMNAQKA